MKNLPDGEENEEGSVDVGECYTNVHFIYTMYMQLDCDWKMKLWKGEISVKLNLNLEDMSGSWKYCIYSTNGIEE